MKEFEQKVVAIENATKEEKKKKNIMLATMLIATMSLFGVGALMSTAAEKYSDRKKLKK